MKSMTTRAYGPHPYTDEHGAMARVPSGALAIWHTGQLRTCADTTARFSRTWTCFYVLHRAVRANVPGTLMGADEQAVSVAQGGINGFPPNVMRGARRRAQAN